MKKVPLGRKMWEFDKFPNKCPQCHHAIDPRQIGIVVRKEVVMGSATVELIFQCPQEDCLRAFIGLYIGDYSQHTRSHMMMLRATSPFIPEPPEHSSEVRAVSPQAVAIYREAAAAEAWNLKEIAGCGYRKALEFLVKDYCVSLGSVTMRHTTSADGPTWMSPISKICSR